MYKATNLRPRAFVANDAHDIDFLTTLVGSERNIWAELSKRAYIDFADDSEIDNVRNVLSESLLSAVAREKEGLPLTAENGWCSWGSEICYMWRLADRWKVTLYSVAMSIIVGGTTLLAKEAGHSMLLKIEAYRFKHHENGYTYLPNVVREELKLAVAERNKCVAERALERQVAEYTFGEVTMCRKLASFQIRDFEIEGSETETEESETETEESETEESETEESETETEESETESETEDDYCVICLDAKKGYACVPCGHLCLCGGCAAGAKPTECPICRGPISTIVKIFL